MKTVRCRHCSRHHYIEVNEPCSTDLLVKSVKENGWYAQNDTLLPHPLIFCSWTCKVKYALRGSKAIYDLLMR